MTLRHLSLFTGSGIGNLAAQEARIATVAQCENDPVCQHILRTLWPDAHLFEDIRHVSAQSLQPFLPVDLISGGWPCQDISTAGKGYGLRGARSGLWFEMLRVISEIRPTWVLAENVPALRSRGADEVLAGLEAEGYACWPVVVGAWAVGAPHKRDRVWIVAHCKCTGLEGSSRTKQQSSKSAARSLSESGRAPRNDQRWAGSGSGRQSFEAGGSGGGELADPIGNLCGRGGDESERGSEGGTAIRWPSSPMGHPEGGGAPTREQPGRLQDPLGSSEGLADAGCGHDGVAGVGSAQVMAHANRRHGGTSWWTTTSVPPQLSDRTIWPSPPGEPQHDWEAPRLIPIRGVHPAVRAFLRKAGPPLVEQSRAAEATEKEMAAAAVALFKQFMGRLGQSAYGLSAQVRRRSNKSLLRILGNAWVYPLASTLFQWIADQHSLPRQRAAKEQR